MATKKKKEATPLMKQYWAIKAKHHDALLLFRVGDFYETFGEDAITASKVLGIILTKRHNGSASEIELAGFPYHSLNTYLPKLVRAGFRVAICDQLEKPSKEKKIVKRGVTELITPGVALNDNILDTGKNNFLASVFINKNSCGAAFIDISTGEFYVAEGSIAYIDKLLQSFLPSEVLYPKKLEKEYLEHFGTQYYHYRLEDWIYTDEFTTETIQKQFDVISLKGFGIENSPEIILASGAALFYFGENHMNDIKQLNTISRLTEDSHVWMDKFSIKNLELVYSPHQDAKTLADVLDFTVSPMGARLIKKWILMPLVDISKIQDRYDIVQFFMEQDEIRKNLITELKKIGDIERMISKVPSNKINPREVVQLKRALKAIEPIQKLMLDSKIPALQKYGEQLNPCPILIEKLENELVEEAPVQLHKSPTINEGVNKELDDLREISSKGKDYLIEIQQREAEKTGITSLKIGFNNVFGYYLEVRNTHKDRVPETWIRKQTLTAAERYITEELKEYEEKILGAQDKIEVLELKIYNEVVSFLRNYIAPIQHNANLLGRIDCLLSFALVAERYNYCRPNVDDSLIIDIKEARHPVIEAQLPVGESYIPNDIYLNNDDQQIIMITGPNMSGKSAVLRQTALTVLMAQMGCFVPAKSATIGIIDKIFTRVGASDNISSGESTFMVEMNETANIVNNISNRSLILLDEIGRGTSTYDGISIAWSIAEYLHNHPKFKAKTLFATHYHELNELTEKYPRIRNYNISTKELKNKVLFLRKLTPGGSKHSFGIHVAKMAGMPKEIVVRANEILKQLEQKHIDSGDVTEKIKNIPANMQLSIFDSADPKAAELKEAMENIDINTLTPVEALMKLNELKKFLEE